MAHRHLLAAVLRAARRRTHNGDRKVANALLRFAAMRRGHARLWAQIGHNAMKANDHVLAITSLRTAVVREPFKGRYHARLGAAYLKLGFAIEARACAERSLALGPACPHAHLLLADLHGADADADLQLHHLKNAVALSTSRQAMASNLLRLAEAFTDRADRQAMIDSCLQAIELTPAAPLAYAMLARTGFYHDAAHPHIHRLEELLRDKNTPIEDRRILHFTLGLIYDHHESCEKAFRHFQRGNAIALRSMPFDPRQPARDAEQRITVFSAERVDELSRHAADSIAPIFVVGMPRSGTTLIEQILSSHRDVWGLGESTTLLDLTRCIATELSWTHLQYPECLEFLGADALRRFANQFLLYISAAAHGRPRAVTKRPNDFWEVGLIHTLLPNAKVIHCVRDSRDTCLSCFMQDFGDVAFANSLDHLAAYYVQYERIMNHWHSIMEPHSLYDLRYERLVESPEEVIDDVLDFCELARDDTCCRFFESTRPIYTASAWQVRQPIYRRSIGRWHRYEKWLGALRRLD